MSTRVFIGAIVVVAMVLIAASAQAQIYFGLTHSEVGAARITPGTGEITISGFGADGTDGVTIDPGIAECTEVSLDPGDTSGYPDGAELIFEHLRSDADRGTSGVRERVSFTSGNPLYEGQTVEVESAIYGGKSFIGAEGMRVRVLRQNQVVYEEAYTLPYADPVLAGFTLPDGVTVSGCCADPCLAGKAGGPRPRHTIALSSVHSMKGIAADGRETDVAGDEIQIEFEYSTQSDCPCAVDEVGIYAKSIPGLTVYDEALLMERAEVRGEKFNVKQEFGPVQGQRRLAMGGGTGTVTISGDAADLGIRFPSDATDPFLDPGADPVASVSVGMSGLDTLTFSTSQGASPPPVGITARPFQERDLIYYSGDSIVATETVAADVLVTIASGISQDGDVQVDGGGFSTSFKNGKTELDRIVTPFTDVTDGGWRISFPSSQVTLPGGGTATADSIRVQCPLDRPFLCPDGSCQASRDQCAAALPAAELTVSDPTHEVVADKILVYEPYLFADIGVPPTSGGTFAIGDRICIEIPASDPTGIEWTRDGVALEGANTRRICIDGLSLADSGVYRASYDDGSKAPATYTVVINVVAALPVAWVPVGIAVGAAAVGSLLAARRRTRP